MKGLVAFAPLVVLAIALLCLSASETLPNHTGKIASGFVIPLSEPVRISSYDESAFPDRRPSEPAHGFTFSIGALGDGGRLGLSWTPSSASPTASSCLANGGAGSLGSGASSGLPESASRILVSDTSDLYGYLGRQGCVARTSAQPVDIPLYVSVPIETPFPDKFDVVADGSAVYDLTRVDAVSLYTRIVVRTIPGEVTVQVRRNGVPIRDAALTLSNVFQAITIGVPDLAVSPRLSPFPAEFIKGVALRDCWNSFFYGIPGEEALHRRDFADSTIERVAQTGATDLYLTSFFGFWDLLPTPLLQAIPAGVACETVSETDLAHLADVAHRNGLRMHLMFNGITLSSAEAERRQLSAPKTTEWLVALFDQYKTFMLSQAKLAERCGVDAIMLDWQDSTVRFDGQERLWSRLMGDVIRAVRSSYRGMIEYNIVRPSADVSAFVSGLLTVEDFSLVDAFHYSQWELRTTGGDSVSALYAAFEEWLEPLKNLVRVTGKPICIQAELQSTKGYFRDGWHDVAIGEIGGAMPDFFAQARGYEALFQACSRSEAICGISLYKYDFDDPFGPNYCSTAISRMDLSGSIRNKPSEALVKRWFGGVDGPTSILPNAGAILPAALDEGSANAEEGQSTAEDVGGGSPDAEQAPPISSLPTGNIMGAGIGGNWGDTYYYIDDLPDDYFRFLVETGFTWACISLSLVVDDSMDATVEIAGADEPTPAFTDTQLRRLIDRLHEAGLSVYITLAFENGNPAPVGKQVERWQFGDPYAYLSNPTVSKEYWPWDPAYPGHEEFVDTFFRTYGDAAVHFAEIAQEKGVGLFGLGTETNRLFRTRAAGSDWPTEYSTQLTQIVQRVRNVYAGPLTYDSYCCGVLTTDIPPNSQYLWGDLGLDVIGISAYFPLLDAPASSVPSVGVLEQEWQQIFDSYLRPLRVRYPDKEMLFLELGYTDGVGSAANPGQDEFQRKVFVDKDKNGLDNGEEEQANILRALFATMERNLGILKGGFLWGHQISPDSAWEGSFGAMRHYSVRGRLAEEVVKEFAARWRESWPEPLRGENLPAEPTPEPGDATPLSARVSPLFELSVADMHVPSAVTPACWASGAVLRDLSVAVDASGAPYLSVATNGQPFTGVVLQLGGKDLSQASGLYLRLASDGPTKFHIDLAHRDPAWPAGNQIAATPEIVVESLSPTVLYIPFSEVTIGPEDLAECGDCEAAFHFEDVDFLHLVIHSGASDFRLYEVGTYSNG